jgi:hypothetical protein
MKTRFPVGSPNNPKTTPSPLVGEKVGVRGEEPTEKKSQFTSPPTHGTIAEKATHQGHVVPLTKKAKADPLLGARETNPGRVSEKIPTPQRPPGYSPRQLWQEIIVMGTGHEDARALIGRKDLVEKLKGIGFDVGVATEWRDFFHGIDRVSTERGSPNPSAKGRAEFADWVVVQLGGASAGFWKGAAA